jgi:hypothetical protein
MDSSIIIIFLVAWLFFRFVGSLNKKKPGNQTGQQQGATGQTAAQQQDVELQKRLREAYEAAQQQAARQHPQADDDIPPYRRVAVDDDIPPYRRQPADDSPVPVRSHHLDEAEEERCAAATRAKEEQRQQQRQQTGYQTGRSLRSQTQMQAVVKLPDPAPQEQDLISKPDISIAPSMKIESSSIIQRSWDLSKAVLTQGIIMAEVLGPPRSKKRHLRNF